MALYYSASDPERDFFVGFVPRGVVILLLLRVVDCFSRAHQVLRQLFANMPTSTQQVARYSFRFPGPFAHLTSFRCDVFATGHG